MPRSTGLGLKIFVKTGLKRAGDEREINTARVLIKYVTASSSLCYSVFAPEIFLLGNFMKIATTKELGVELQKLTCKVRKRLWIASPFVGSWYKASCLIGTRWQNHSDVKVRLLTDKENKGWLDPTTIRKLASRGKVKHLRGLHAKIFIIDDNVLVTSANLTGTAFERRYEIGAFLSSSESVQVIKYFEEWWKKAEYPEPGWIEELEASNQYNGRREEPGGTPPKKLCSLKQPEPEGKYKNQKRVPFMPRNGAGLTAPSPKKFKALFAKSNRFFVCNTDRRYDPNREAEIQMLDRGCAAAWEEFRFPNHMNEVKRGHAILFYAKGKGIIGIGCAKTSRDILEPGTPDRIKGRVRSREWQIPLDWLIRADDNERAFEWKSPPPTFFEVTGKQHLNIRRLRRYFAALLFRKYR